MVHLRRVGRWLSGEIAPGVTFAFSAEVGDSALQFIQKSVQIDRDKLGRTYAGKPARIA